MSISHYTNRTLWPLFFSVTLSLLVTVGIQFDFGIAALMVTFVFFSGIILWKVATKKLDKYNRDWVRLASELTVPTALWLLFGLGGILSFFEPEVVTKFGTTYEPATVFLTAIYVSIGAICYVGGFRGGFRNSELRVKGKKVVSKRVFIFMLVVLLAFDWYVRFDQIRGGVYFDWLKPYSKTRQALLRGINPLYHLHDDVALVVLVLLMYSVIVFANRRFYAFLLSIQTVLILLQGQRRNLLLVAFAILFPYISLRRLQIRRKHLIFILLFTLLFFGVIFPIIEESRLMMKYDARNLMFRPKQIIVRYVVEYIPQSFRILGNSQASLRTQPRVSLTERVGGYMSYAASIHQAMLDGHAGPNYKKLGIALSLVIPRFLYPRKPVVDANDVVYEHFEFGRLGYDATGTPIADVFSYLHLPGIILLFIVVGLGYGFVARHLRISYGTLGDMIMIGILPSAFPTGDAFGGYLASLRNVLLFVFLIDLFVNASVIFRSKRIRKVKYMLYEKKLSVPCNSFTDDVINNQGNKK